MSGRRGDRDISAAQAQIHGFDARIDVAVRLAVLGAGEGGVLGRLDPDHVGEHTGQVDGAFDGREPAEGELAGVVGDCEGPGQWEREDGEGGKEGDCAHRGHSEQRCVVIAELLYSPRQHRQVTQVQHSGRAESTVALRRASNTSKPERNRTEPLR